MSNFIMKQNMSDQKLLIIFEIGTYSEHITFI